MIWEWSKLRAVLESMMFVGDSCYAYLCINEKTTRRAPIIGVLNKYRDDGMMCIDSLWSHMMMQSRAPVFQYFMGQVARQRAPRL